LSFSGFHPLKDGVAFTDYKATGFFVAIPLHDDGNPFGEGFVYLVTAKHVAQKLAGKEFVVRANTRDGNASVVFNDVCLRHQCGI
jgi:hypothetical protein